MHILHAAAAVPRESLRRHRVLAGIICVYAIACFSAGRLSGGRAVVDIFGLYWVFALLLAAGAIILLLASVLRVMLARPDGSLYRAIWRDLSARWLAHDRLSNLLVPLLLTPLFFSAFSSFKSLIPYVAPFSWDETFMRWDRWLHGGIHPWLLLQPLLGAPWVTAGVDALYYAWLPVMLGMYFWQIVSVKRAALRMQFLISFLLSWILIGTALATLLSSVGPCYYGRVAGPPDPYLPLMEYLYAAAKQVPMMALDTQEMLWRNHQVSGTTIGSGISAMPSMHVAIAVLLVLFGWRRDRRAGLCLTAFAVLTMIGSVHLGWHYAIDGYLAAIVVVAIWYGVGRVLRRAEHGIRIRRGAACSGRVT